MAEGMLSEAHILDALRDVKDPLGKSDIVSAGMVSGVQIGHGGEVLFTIEVDPKSGPALEGLRQKAEDIVRGLKDVHKVTAVLTAERVQASSSPANDGVQGGQFDPHGMAKNPPLKLPIKRILAVASGKGGVGKSTIAAALAQNISKNSQLTVGVLDADIYGPSQPKLFGLEGQKPAFDEAQKIIPPEAYGVKIMSIGFMVEAEKALIWRGPMVQSAIYQLFRDVDWSVRNDKSADADFESSALDLLIVDMPPGTGDAQLTLAQKIPVDGAIIVSTPQDLALADARKAVQMFETVNVPILGLIENMSTHICTNCGHEEHIFGHGGARAEAEKLGVPFLGEFPLSADIRAQADAGQRLELDFDLSDIIPDYV